MAIRIIDGVPGSGKTYYAVKHLLDNYFYYNKEVADFESKKPCTIITNIEDFKLDHLSLSDEVAKVGSVVDFFSDDFQAEYRHRFDNVLVYVIDEAQKYFRRSDRKLSPVFGYFEYHRHYGQDIYLVTQNVRKLPTDIVDLVEYVVRASPRVRSISGEMKYKWLSDGIQLKIEAFRPDQKVFDIYKSQDNKEIEKIKNPVMRTFFIIISVTSVLFLSFAYILYSSFFVKEESVVSYSDNVEEDLLSDVELSKFFKCTVNKFGVKTCTNISY